MSKQKYALIKVNTPCSNCELIQILGEGKAICCKDKEWWERKCNYGDTREQFVNKIATGIEIAINEYEKGNIPKGQENRRCAEIIAEYLGVKK